VSGRTTPRSVRSARGSVMAGEPARRDAREPAVSAHEAREFANSVEYTVQITFVVAGGARWRTAHARARKVAERLANTAARAKGVVEVHAVAGAGRNGELPAPERVCFEAANSGHGTNAEPAKLDRYLDPDHERAVTSLEEANAAARARQQADRNRRQEIGCANPSQLTLGLGRPCGCAYCRPIEHLAARRPASGSAPGGHASQRCRCGRAVDMADPGCRSHRDRQLVVLDGDPPELVRLAADVARGDPPRPGRDQSSRPDGPDLAPPGR
jgi:hypothetical protein